MRIAYILPDIDRPGGIERYVREHIKHLRSSNDITVFTTGAAAAAAGENRRVLVSTAQKPYFLKFYQFSRRSTRAVKPAQFDIVHNQGANSLVQHVVTAHSCHRAWVEMAKRFSAWEFAKKALNPIHRIVLSNEKKNYSPGGAQRIIAVSRSVKEEIIRYHGFPPDRIDVVPNGVDLDEFNPGLKKVKAAEVRKALGIGEETLLLLLVANEFRRKGLSALIGVLERLKGRDIRLLAVGKGSVEYFKALAVKSGVDRMITFMPNVREINVYFAAADLFVLPAKYEPFGLVVLEAMAAGTPVITTRVAGVSDHIGDGEGLILDRWDDIDALQAGILRFYDNRSLTAEWGARARKKAENFSWKNIVNKTYEVYKKIT